MRASTPERSEVRKDRTVRANPIRAIHAWVSTEKGTATVLRSGVLAAQFQGKTPDLNTFAPSPTDIQGTRPTGSLTEIPRTVRGREPVPFFRPRARNQSKALVRARCPSRSPGPR